MKMMHSLVSVSHRPVESPNTYLTRTCKCSCTSIYRRPQRAYGASVFTVAHIFSSRTLSSLPSTASCRTFNSSCSNCLRELVSALAFNCACADSSTLRNDVRGNDVALKEIDCSTPNGYKCSFSFVPWQETRYIETHDSLRSQ